MKLTVVFRGSENKTQLRKFQEVIIISLGDLRSFSFSWLLGGYEMQNASDFVILILETSERYQRGR